MEELELTAKLGLTAHDPSVRSDMIMIIGQVGKVQLSQSQGLEIKILNVS